MTRNKFSLSRRNVLKKGALVSSGLIVGGVATSGTAAAGIGDGRIADYHLNNLNYDRDRGDIVAGHVHDSSPEKNHGEWHDHNIDPVVKNGAVGKAFTFDGSADHFTVDFGDSPNLTDWTVAGWIRPNTWDDNARKEWVSVSEDRSEDGFQPLDFVHEDGQIKHYRGEAAGEVMAYDVSDETGWHHMTVTQKRSSESNVDLRMYFDGTEVDSDSGDYENMRPSLNFYVGTLSRPNDKQSFWHGELDQIRVYDRVLSTGEIIDLYEMCDDCS